MCWYCQYGWPKPVADIFNRYALMVHEDVLECGPAHIVWGDNNFETHDIEWCLETHRFNRSAKAHELSEFERDAVRKSLIELLEVPESVRCPKEAELDVPPPPETELVRM